MFIIMNRLTTQCFAKYKSSVLMQGSQYWYIHTSSSKFHKNVERESKSFTSGTRNVPTKPHRTAGLIVIGDEILKGQVQDTNSHFVTKVFYDLGIQVKRISVIGDSEEDIVKEIQSCSSKYTYVITTGGIGPTHDDITFEAIAKAFGEPLILHPTLVQVCRQFYQSTNLNAAELKLANVPKSAKLTFGYDRTRGERTRYPNIAVHNVYIFPGVPQLMERLFTSVCRQLFDGGNTHFFLRELYVTDPESTITQPLNETVKDFPDVIFGSYPKFFDSYYKVRVTIESEDEGETARAYEKLRSRLPQNAIIDYDKDPLENAYDKIMKLVTKDKNSHIQNAVNVVEACAAKHSPESVCIYFNGEIESTAILHMYYACLNKRRLDDNIMVFYVHEAKPTQEIRDYLRETIVRYNVNIEILRGPPSSTIASFVAAHKERRVIVIGSTKLADDWTRQLKSASERSDVTLVQPFDGWSDAQVWGFVRSLCLPYCSSYDQQQT